MGHDLSGHRLHHWCERLVRSWLWKVHWRLARWWSQWLGLTIPCLHLRCVLSVLIRCVSWALCLLKLLWEYFLWNFLNLSLLNRSLNRHVYWLIIGLRNSLWSIFIKNILGWFYLNLWIMTELTGLRNNHFSHLSGGRFCRILQLLIV